MAKQKIMTSPKGTAEWPRLQSPDTRFDEDGVYKVDLRMPKADAKDFVKALKTLQKEAVAQHTKGDNKPKAANLPVYVVEDDEGNKTDDVRLRFKVKATMTSRKTGESWSRKPKLFDTKGKPYTGEDVIGSGSVLKIAAEPYVWNSSFGVGITLQPTAVQIIDLVPYVGGNSNATSFGFGEEEGFEAEATDDFDFDGNDEDATDGDDDF